MKDLMIFEKQLPDNIEDLSKFVIFSTEKIKSVKAEINLITKLGLAQEVYDQKIEEQRLLGELILDASVKLGEFSKGLPKGSGGDRKSNRFKNDSIVCFDSGKTKSDSSVDFHSEKTKKQTMQDLGFSPKQVERFEILANNKDVVEQVKQEARENDDIPTRSRVIDLVKQKKQAQEEFSRQVDADRNIYKEYLDVVYAIQTYDITDEKIEAILRRLQGVLTLQDELVNIDRAIRKLLDLKNRLILKGVKKHGKP